MQFYSEKNIAFHFKMPLIPLVKHVITDESNNEMIEVHTILKLKPLFKFFRDGKPIYSAILKTCPGNFMKKQFIIYDFISHEQIAVVNERSIHKKRSVFTEFDIEIEDTFFKAKYELMYKSFSITDMNNRLCVKGEKTSSLFKDLLKRRSYRVEIQNKDFEPIVWLAVVKGMQFLE